MDLEGNGEARDRVRRLRWKAVAICMVCFALIWGVITIQMAQGDDPALASEAASGTSASPRESQGLPDQRGLPGEGGFGGGLPGGAPQGSPEEFLFEGGGSGSGELGSPGGEFGEGTLPEAPGGSQEGLEPMHTHQS